MTRHLLLSILALALTACSTAPAPSEPPTSVSSARARWSEAAGDDYRYDFQRNCFCVREAVQPVTIEVRDGQIASIVSRETGQAVGELPGVEWYTIEELFGLIEEAEAEGQTVAVEYAAEGYPTSMTIGSLAADAGIEYTVQNLQPL